MEKESTWEWIIESRGTPEARMPDAWRLGSWPWEYQPPNKSARVKQQVARHDFTIAMKISLPLCYIATGRSIIWGTARTKVSQGTSSLIALALSHHNSADLVVGNDLLQVVSNAYGRHTHALKCLLRIIAKDIS